MSAARARHPVPALEHLLCDVEAHAWTVTRAKKYYRCACPCGVHLKWIHLTPSDPNYARNQRAWFTRQACWEE